MLTWTDLAATDGTSKTLRNDRPSLSGPINQPSRNSSIPSQMQDRSDYSLRALRYSLRSDIQIVAGLRTQ